MLRHYNRAMQRGILPILLLFSSLAAAQTAVGIAGEPHYRLLLENEQVRVFGLTLHRDESVFVRLHHSFLTVTLQDGEIIIWDDGKSAIQHFQVHKGEANFVCWSLLCLTAEDQAKGATGGFRNDRQNDYRNITVEFLDPNVGWALLTGGKINPPPPGSMFLGGAIVADVPLQAGESFPAPEKQGAELLIPLSDVDLKGAGGVRVRKSPGEVGWIAANRTSVLANAGREAAWFIIVEFRPDNP
jgi:hypothetical protein